MDTNNLDKWWHGLPENTRQAIGGDGIWEKLDMPSRSALHRYSLLRIYGTAKDRDGERTLLNEIACGLDRTYNSDKQGTGPVIGTSRLQAYGNRYRQKNPENFLCFPSWVAHQRKRGPVLPHRTATGLTPSFMLCTSFWC